MVVWSHLPADATGSAGAALGDFLQSPLYLIDSAGLALSEVL